MMCSSKWRDTNSYDENIVNRNTIPLQSSIQYDGFMNNYFYPLETKKQKKIQHIINADFSYTIANNPINSEKEIFMSILINSNKDGIKQIKKCLDIIIVLDISGSMSSTLGRENNSTIENSCLSLAKDSVKKLFNKLKTISNNSNSYFNFYRY